MKKITICILALCMSFTFTPNQLEASTNNVVAAKTEAPANAKSLMNRLHEIKAMNKSGLNSSEKKSLRNEVLSIKQQLSDVGGGVYISAGALILILLLLIILT